MISDMQVYDFTKPELEYFREQCNFTPPELEYFNLRAQYKSNIQISMTMNVSERQVTKLSKKVKSKIMRVL
ncbi:MAG: hypothetical protein IJH36_03090 [Clostridia bacterium]|nr:hypothetical protein [Clostridia bacterium]MBQ3462087.1 hypothetical protein [Clostridia bacterium]MBQ9599413.1 hypothetical protein [Clostridia bacterium]